MLVSSGEVNRVGLKKNNNESAVERLMISKMKHALHIFSFACR